MPAEFTLLWRAGAASEGADKESCTEQTMMQYKPKSIPCVPHSLVACQGRCGSDRSVQQLSGERRRVPIGTARSSSQSAVKVRVLRAPRSAVSNRNWRVY